MCGRYSMSQGPDQLSSRVQAMNLAVADILNGKQATISHNIAPTNYGAVYYSNVNPHMEVSKDGEVEGVEKTPEQNTDSNYVIQYMKWGLVPSFFKDTRNSFRMFNCRVETLAQNKSVWAGPKKHNRCLIPVEGYYEWIGTGQSKVPYYVKRRDGKLLFLAGLWDRNTHEDVLKDQKKVFEDKAGSPALFTYTIITTSAPEDISWLHERMPVIVDIGDKELQSSIQDWLNPMKVWADNSDEFMSLIKPFDASNLEVYKVSTDVNKTGVDNANLNKPLEASTFFSKEGSIEDNSKTFNEEKNDTKEQEKKRKKPDTEGQDKKGKDIDEQDVIKKENSDKGIGDGEKGSDKKAEKLENSKPKSPMKRKKSSLKSAKHNGEKRQSTIPLESPAKRTRSHSKAV